MTFRFAFAAWLVSLFAAGALGACQTPPGEESQAVAASGASRATIVENTIVATRLPDDREDEDFATRGFIASWPDAEIKDARGRTVWNFTAYDFLKGPAPDTVNPSLWRHAGLLTRHGLFKVHERIYQLRGFDLANMTVIVGDTGLIIVDPLTSVEAARAGLQLARRTLGDKPVVAVIYTHSHIDHFGGVRGVADAADVAAGRIAVIAPEGFVEHAVSENIIAGNAMTRRAIFQFGTGLGAGPEASMGSGIGSAVSAGQRTLIAPTDSITRTGETRTIDGVRFVFQMTPNSEAPAELNFFLPEFRALCLAENANASMHNVLTPRGALVRDAKLWADYLTESLRLYGADTEIMFTSHAWPRFGGERVRDFIASHRDAYKYLHDQSVRLMNMGYTGDEIAERIALPQALADRWFNRGYYGTMRHNSRAVYQRYMGWYDGNPAHLNALPHETSAPRYVEAMGGAAKVMALADAAMQDGDYRWAAELLDKAVFADPANMAAREKLAAAHTQMAFQTESAIWRNLYLVGARELRNGPPPAGAAEQSLDMIAATPSGMLLDLLAVRLNPERAAGQNLSFNIVFPERNERFAVSVRNSVLVHEAGVTLADATASITLSRVQFLQAMLAPATGAPAAMPGQVTGDSAAWGAFRSLFEIPAPNFAIVTP